MRKAVDNFIHRKRKMHPKERLSKLAKHIEENPSDYQAVVGYMKLQSDEIEWELEQRKRERQKKIAECKRIYEKRKTE